MKKRESKKVAFIPPLRVPEEFAERGTIIAGLASSLAAPADVVYSAHEAIQIVEKTDALSDFTVPRRKESPVR